MERSIPNTVCISRNHPPDWSGAVAKLFRAILSFPFQSDPSFGIVLAHKTPEKPGYEPNEDRPVKEQQP